MINLIKAPRHSNASPRRIECVHMPWRDMWLKHAHCKSFSIYWQPQIDLVFRYDHMHFYSGFLGRKTPKDFPPPSARTEESVSESASGTCSRILAWEQISCPCVYLVLTVHTGLFSTAPGCISTHSFPFSEGSISQQPGSETRRYLICLSLI